MSRKNWRTRIGRLVVLAVPGMMVLGTSCASDIRRSLVAAGLDFVKSNAGDVLGTLFPVDQFLNGQ